MGNISKVSAERMSAMAEKAAFIGKGQSFSQVVVISPGNPSTGNSVSGSPATDGTARENASMASLPECFVLDSDSRLDLVVVVLPGAGCKLDIAVILDGERAEANISGLYVCPGNEKVSISMELLHKAPHCISRQLFKGLAGGGSKVDFHGKVIVAQDAQKTEAYQENHNILLSEHAVVNTKPQLEIYADDVKCSHGATIGRLNEEEQFYMRSRGISADDARALQMISFLSPVAGAIPDAVERETVLEAVEAAVRQF
ncbi:MAG: SufD family Fe-S cluster assembly protein [Bacteroidales bacterium]|nr:SufD family Fe-S cluster assembly protein [Bacteroides sp.]MCM1198144.1 SufD family Fe-S cluster assembly protein [Clostridium sp.]MCM1501754.1 SufD family Fe-S cluster assembly protein [Bacteroidales bacterium]